MVDEDMRVTPAQASSLPAGDAYGFGFTLLRYFNASGCALR